METAAPRIGLWGTFDLENYGDLLFPRIAEHELRARLPRAAVRPYSPYGFWHPVRLDPGLWVDPLGAWDETRVAELSEELDCIVIGGGEIIHTADDLLAGHYSATVYELRQRAPSKFFIEALGPEFERDHPVIWHAVGIPSDPTEEEAARLRAALAARNYVAVRGETSRRRLMDAGVRREIAVVPDSTFLLPRLFPEDLLHRRLEDLRALGWYPADRDALVVQGSRELIPSVGVLAAEVETIVMQGGDLTPVIVGTEPCHGDHEFAHALTAALNVPAYHMPEDAVVEDLVAAIWGSRGFCGISLHGNITAFCFDKPHVAVNPLTFSKLDDFEALIGLPGTVIRDPSELAGAFELAERSTGRPETLHELQRQIDAHFDQIARIAAGAAKDTGVGATSPGNDSLLRHAYNVRGRRMVEERFALTEALVETRARERALAAELDARLEELASTGTRHKQEIRRVARLEEQLAAARRELEVLHHSRSLRYTSPLRRIRRRLHWQRDKRR